MLSAGKYLERGWGSREFFKYVAITSIGPMLGIYFTCLFEFVVRGNDELLYAGSHRLEFFRGWCNYARFDLRLPFFFCRCRFDTQAYGLTSVIAGFVIGFKQLIPDHVITFWGFLSMRVGVSRPDELMDINGELLASRYLTKPLPVCVN